jgi:hypothetical protein
MANTGLPWILAAVAGLLLVLTVWPACYPSPERWLWTLQLLLDRNRTQAGRHQRQQKPQFADVQMHGSAALRI